MASIDLFEVYTSFTTDGDGRGKIPGRFLSDISLYFKNCNIELIARKKRSRRTLPQNAFLHVLFTIFSVELISLTGNKIYTPVLVKSMMKLKFLKYDLVDENTGEVVGEAIKDTHTLKKGECADFISEVLQYAAEKYHIVLPEPKEQIRLSI